MPNIRRLYVLRHGKSVRDIPSPPDHDRPLAPRGERAADRIARHLRDQGISPDLILCSSSLRTRQTLDRLAPSFGPETTVKVERALYEAPAAGILERVRRTPDEVGSVMLIGHNPGLQDLALMLAGRGERLPMLKEKFPTGGLATLEFEGGWADLAEGSATLIAYVVPRQMS